MYSPSDSSHTKGTRYTTENHGHIALGREPRRQPWDHLILAREVKEVVGVARSISSGRYTSHLTKVQKVLRDDGLFLKHLRGLDHRRRQAAVHVPFNVAVEEPHARVVSSEADHEVARRLDYEGVAAHGHSGDRVGECSVEVHCVVVAPGDDLEGVAVQMERMLAGVVVVEYEFDDLAMRKDEGVGVFSVDSWV